MKNPIITAIFLLFLGFSSLSLDAETLIYDFSGIITNVSSATSGIAGSVPLGAPFTASFQINLNNVTDVNPGALNGNYYALSPGSSVDVSVGTLSLSTTPDSIQPATIQTSPLNHVDSFYSSDCIVTQATSTIFTSDLQINVIDASFDRSIPTDITASQVSLANWSLGYFNGTDSFDVTGSISSISVQTLSVPEPSTWTLGLIVLAGCLLSRSRLPLSLSGK